MSSSRKIKILDQEIFYTIKKHSRAKNITLSITPHGQVTLTTPWFVPQMAAQKFLLSNQNWVIDRLKVLSRRPKPTTYSAAQITEMKIKTRDLVRHRLSFFNQHYGYKYSRITIRHQKTRWGSCSSNGTLSFNCKLCLLPPEISDYIVVHELCHLKQMNHSPAFWQLVSQTIPQWKKYRRQLRLISQNL